MSGMTVEQASAEEDKHSGMSVERLSDIAEDSLDYRTLAASIVESCEPLLCHGGTVLDLHCGKGELISQLLPSAGGGCRFIAFDNEQCNVDACEDRFRWLSHQGFVQVRNRSLDSNLPSVANCLTIEEFGLGPLENHRVADVLCQSRMSLQKGGAMIVVERSDRPWISFLQAAGFRNVMRIWKRGGSEALLAEK